MGFDKVSATNYYKDDGDKIKLNWFLYEYANLLYMEITASPKLVRYRKLHTDDQIASFCVYFSKRLRKSIYDEQTGQSDKIVFDGRYINEFYPHSSLKQTQSLLDAALEAWKGQLLACTGCSSKCLMDGYEITGMFDSLKNTGWPT
jgi:uncharacterized Fe-S radical SAM superfamily protein PflX